MSSTIATMQEAFGDDLFSKLERSRIGFSGLDPWSDDGIRDFMLQCTVSELCAMIKKCGSEQQVSTSSKNPKKKAKQDTTTTVIDEASKRQAVEDSLRYVKLWIRFYGFLPPCPFETHGFHEEHRDALTLRPPAGVASPGGATNASGGSPPMQPPTLVAASTPRDPGNQPASPHTGGSTGGKRSLPSLEGALSIYDQLNQVLEPCQIQVGGSTAKKEEEGRPSGGEPKPEAEGAGTDPDPSRSLFGGEKKEGNDAKGNERGPSPLVALDLALVVMTQLLQDMLGTINQSILVKAPALDRLSGREIGFLFSMVRGLGAPRRQEQQVVPTAGGATPSGTSPPQPAPVAAPRIVETKAPNKEALLIDVRSTVYQKLQKIQALQDSSAKGPEASGGAGSAKGEFSVAEDDDENRPRTRPRRAPVPEKDEVAPEPVKEEKPVAAKNKRQVGKKESREDAEVEATKEPSAPPMPAPTKRAKKETRAKKEESDDEQEDKVPPAKPKKSTPSSATVLRVPPEVQLYLHLGPLFQHILQQDGPTTPKGELHIPLVPGTAISAVPDPTAPSFAERCLQSFDDAQAAQHPAPASPPE